jgi:hypothetical protein
MADVELYAERKRSHRRTWTLAAVLLGLVFMILGQVGAYLPAREAGWITPGGGTDGWPQLTYELVAAFGLGSVLLLLWVGLFERRGPATLGLNAKGPTRFLRGYLIGLAFLLAVVGIIWGAGGYVVEGAGAFGSAAVGAALLPIGALMLGFIVQGSSEELMFRGWLMQLIASRHGVWIAVVANSVLFALAHAGNIEPSNELYVGLANIVLFGLFVSLYAVREGSIWGVCGWHAAWNWLLGLGFGLEVSGITIDSLPLVTDLTAAPGAAWWLTGGAFGPEASIVTTAVLLTGTVVLALWGRTRSHGVEAAGSAAPAPT